MTASRRILFAAWPFPGHVFPQIAVAHALRDLGHDCAFYTGKESAEIVRQEGFDCFPFHHVNEAGIGQLMQNRPQEPWRISSLPQLGLLLRRWLLDTLPDQILDLEAIVASWRPHAIASDPTMWAPMLVLYEKLRIPVGVCSFIPACPLPGRDAPPFGPGLARHPRWRGSMVSELARVSNALSARVGRRAVNHLRRQHGLASIDMSATEYSGRMPLYLVPASREFDYSRRDLPATVHYVGPYLWNRPRTEATASWLADLRRDVPCVHVTEGTVHVQTPFVLEAALAGLGGLPLQVVATLGGNRAREMLDATRIPENVRVERWVSHADLLPLTNVMVTTGGAGSVLAALSAGVPLVIVPTEWDKPEIAQRVVEAGAGVRLAPQHCTPDRLRASVLQVLGEATYRMNAERLSRQFAGLGGARRAAVLIAALADGALSS